MMNDEFLFENTSVDQAITLKCLSKWVSLTHLFTCVKCTHTHGKSTLSRDIGFVQTVFWHIQIVSRLILESLDSKNHMNFANRIHATYRGGLKCDSIQIFTDMSQSSPLATQIRFQSVFCVTPNVAHNDDVKSRMTEVRQSG